VRGNTPVISEDRKQDRAGTRGGRGRRALAGGAWLAIVLVGALIAAFTVLPRSAPAAPPERTVVASLPFWNISHGTATVLAHRGDFTEVSPWMYGLTRTAAIDAQYLPSQAPAVNAAIGRLRGAGLAIVPTLANITAGHWSYRPVAAVLHHPARMEQQVAAIVALVRQHHYAGIDLDYENLRAGDARAFTAFVTALASALHAHGKVLSVAVFAKTTNAGSGQVNRAQNYAAIGRVSDQVRVMAYDYHWASSPPGPVAPIGWVRRVIRYAKEKIPAHKVILGIPLYGYDWSAGRGVAVSWLRAFQLATRYHARARYDTASQEAWFGYRASGRRHVVWFENQASSRAKFGAAAGSGVGGVFLWMFGYEDTGTWSGLGQSFHFPGRAGKP
jgi:spore germination protein